MSHPGHKERLMAHILPNNATDFERALSSEVDRLLEIDTERSQKLWDPWNCHEDDLAYLAWTMSVDIWNPDWPLTKKRSVVANALKHHSLKGTLGGITTYVELVDSHVVKATVPRSTTFSGASLTRQQREEWLQKLPQIRVWRQFERGQSRYRQYFGGTKYPAFMNVKDGEFAAHRRKFLVPSDAAERLRRRARWVLDGKETDARVESFESHFRVFKPGLRPRSTFCNTPSSRKGKFFLPSTAFERVVTIEPKEVSAWRSTVGPSLEPVSSEPEIVAQRSHEGKAVYTSRPMRAGRFYQPSSAPYRLFERYAVNDGSLIAGRRPAVQFMGVGRYGMKPHTAELKIAIRGKRPRTQAGEGIMIPRARFWLPHNPEPLETTRRAIIAAKRRSDAILIDTTTQQGFVAGLPFWAGDDIRI